jgi:peptidoglycan L-alanyl-D-glutamate endopeptidase CwlK
MPQFSKASLDQLATCHTDLQRLAHEMIRIFDFKVVEGHRNKTQQDEAVAAGNSKTAWPNSKHNSIPSLAFDLYPFPVDFSDSSKNLERFVYMHGIAESCAHQLGITIRHGIDWNQNQDMRDEKAFRDYPHIELVNKL